jgi:hypothetical protein
MFLVAIGISYEKRQKLSTLAVSGQYVVMRLSERFHRVGIWIPKFARLMLLAG